MNPSIEHFETERLDARRVQASDLPDIYAMDSDPRVMATLGGLRTNAETRAYLDRNLAHWERHGYGVWTLRSRVDRRFVGRAALRHVEVEGVPEIEVGYALMPEYWRQGLATEVAHAIVSIAFDRLGLGSLVAFCLPTNAGSRRVMEKSGAVYERDIIHAELPHVLYRFNVPPQDSRAGMNGRPKHGEGR